MEVFRNFLTNFYHGESFMKLSCFLRFFMKICFLFFELGNVFNSQGKYEEAIQNFDKSIGIKPDFAKVYISRGVAKIKTGEHDDGCNDLTKAQELGDKGVHAMLKLYCETQSTQPEDKER